jgi:ferrous iron transport protein B
MREDEIRISLVGNPNIGKTSLFNQLTGLHQKVGNFSGVTIEKKTGYFQWKGKRFSVTDLPGTYSLIPKSPDERVVFKEIQKSTDPEQIFMVVADATNLSRNLLFFSQISDLGQKTILVVTMMDMVNSRGKTLDLARLETLVGCPVVAVNGRTGAGIEQVKDKIPEARVPLESWFNPDLSEGPKDIRTFREWLNWATSEIDSDEKEKELSRAKETIARYQKIKSLIAPFESTLPEGNQPGYQADRIALHPVGGYLIMLLVLLVVFEGIFELARYPQDWIESGLGNLSEAVGHFLSDGILKQFLLEGVLAGIQGIVIFIPQIAVLFALIGLLEQSGYMARVMVLLDRFMSRLGMSGKAVIPLVSGVACAVPAIMATRNMNSTRERLIAIFVTPLMSCSARLPVFTLLIGMLIERSASFWGIPLQGLLLFCLYLIGLFGALATAYILHAFLPGKTKEGAFIIEIPPYQLPNWKNLWITVYQKSWSFVWEAGKIIFAISVILWFMAGFGPGNDIEMAEKLAKEEAFAKSFDPVSTERLISSKKLEASFAGRAGQWIEPAIAPMGFDWKIGVALISSFAAREVFVGTMSVLYASGDEEEPRKLQEKMKEARHPDSGKPVFTPAAIASLLVFYIFAMQCMSTLAVTYRETGHWKWPLLQLLYMTGLAFLASMMVYQFLS